MIDSRNKISDMMNTTDVKLFPKVMNNIEQHKYWVIDV